MAFSPEDRDHFEAQLRAGKTFGQVIEAAEREGRDVPSKGTLSTMKKRLAAEKAAAAAPPAPPEPPRAPLGETWRDPEDAATDDATMQEINALRMLRSLLDQTIARLKLTENDRDFHASIDRIRALLGDIEKLAEKKRAEEARWRIVELHLPVREARS